MEERQPMLRQISAIFWKDLLSELRSREMVFSMLIFSLMVALIFNFAFPPGSQFIQEAAPGILWMTFLFAGLIGMNRTFVYEVDRGCLHGIMIAPVDRFAIYAGKLLVNFLFMTIVELVAVPMFIIFFGLTISASVWNLILVIVLSTLGFSIVGTLFSAISVNTRTREVMLPILHFPVSIPLIIGSVEATAAIFRDEGWEVLWGWLKIVIVFDVVFLMVAFLTFEYVIEE
jgi:heme exporter protein B